MAEDKFETQLSDATNFELPTYDDASPSQSAVVIDGFNFFDAYPDHNPGTDGAMHVPAEAFIERKVADIVEVRTATDSLDILSTQVQRLVELASEDHARGDLVVPERVDTMPAENLTHYLRTVIDGKVLEAHRAVIAENKDSQRIINELLSLVYKQSPELVPLAEQLMGERLVSRRVPVQESDGDTVEGASRIKTMDRLLVTPMGKGALRLVKLLKNPFDVTSLEKVS